MNQNEDVPGEGRAAGLRLPGDQEVGRPRSARSVTDAAGRVVAGGFGGAAVTADHQFTLEPRLVVLIRRLLLLPLVLRLNPVILCGRRSVEWADNDFSLRPHMLLWRRLNRLCVVRRGRAKSVPRDRRSGLRCTTISQRAAICEQRRGNKECNAFRNHHDRLTLVQSHPQKPSSARPTQLNANIEKTIATTDAQVAMVFADCMTRTLCTQQSNSVQRTVLNHGENSLRQINQPAVAALPHRGTCLPAKIRICCT
jgi:hypothetical protein